MSYLKLKIQNTILLVFLCLWIAGSTSMPLCYKLLERRIFSGLCMPTPVQDLLITQENLHIRLFDKQGVSYPDNKYVALSDRYRVQSKREEPVVFFFIASDSVQQRGIIKVNGQQITPIPLAPEKDYSFLSKEKSYGNSTHVDYHVIFSEYTIPIRELNDVVYFETPLKVGENIIEIQYEAALDIAGSSFLNDFSLQYYTPFEGYSKDYPPLEVTMECTNNLILNYTSLKVCLDKTLNTFRWQASNKNIREGSYWYFNKQLTPLQQFFLNIEPIGIALILIVVAIIIHLCYLWRRKYNFFDVVGIPFLFCILHSWAYHFIKDFIGDYPPCSTDHSEFLFFLIPIMSLLYWIIVGCFRAIFVRYQKSTKN